MHCDSCRVLIILKGRSPGQAWAWSSDQPRAGQDDKRVPCCTLVYVICLENSHVFLTDLLVTFCCELLCSYVLYLLFVWLVWVILCTFFNLTGGEFKKLEMGIFLQIILSGSRHAQTVPAEQASRMILRHVWACWVISVQSCLCCQTGSRSEKWKKWAVDTPNVWPYRAAPESSWDR